MLIITSVFPKNERRGEETLFYVRDIELQRTFSLEEKIKHTIVTGAMEHAVAEQRIKELREQHKDFDFSLMPYSRAESVIWAKLSKERKSELPNYFIRTGLKRFRVRTADGLYPEKRIAELRKDKRFSSVDFSITKDGKIVALCEKSMIKHLPNYFERQNYTENKKEIDHLGLDSSSRMLRWRFPPFIEAPLSMSEGKLRFDFVEYQNRVREGRIKRASLEALLNQRRAALDIEVERFDTPHEKIYMAVFYTNSSFGNHVLTIYDPGIREIKGLKIILCKDQNDLIEKLEKLERDFDPLFVMGHNIMAYDRLKLRETARKNNFTYAPGQEGDESKVEATNVIRNLRRVVTRGRFEIDTYPYVFHSLNILKDKKLETIARSAGIDFRKSLSYDEMGVRIDEWKSGDVEAGLELVKYCHDDGRISFELGSRKLRNILLKALAVNRSPSAVCASSNTNIVEDYRRRQYFKNLHTFRFEWAYLPRRKTEHQREMDFIQKQKVSHTRKILDLEELMLDFFDFRKTGLRTKVGFFGNSSVVYFTPFAKALEEIIEANEGTRRILQDMRETADFDSKYDLAQFINAFIREPLSDIKKFIEKLNKKLGVRVEPFALGEKLSLDDWRFGKAYGVKKWHDGKTANIFYFNNELASVFGEINEILNGSSIINYSKRFVFFDEPELEKIQKKNLGFVLGRGNIISLGPGRVLASTPLQLEPIYQGVGVSKIDQRYRHFFERFFETALRHHDEEDMFKMVEDLASFMNHAKRKGFIETHGNIIYPPFSEQYRKRLDALFHGQISLI